MEMNCCVQEMMFSHGKTGHPTSYHRIPEDHTGQRNLNHKFLSVFSEASGSSFKRKYTPLNYNSILSTRVSSDSQIMAGNFMPVFLLWVQLLKVHLLGGQATWWSSAPTINSEGRIITPRQGSSTYPGPNTHGNMESWEFKYEQLHVMYQLLL